MNEIEAIANLILGELMNEDFLDPCDLINSREDLIDIIEDFWLHSGETGAILQNGWNLEDITSNNILLDKIIELNNEDNE
jgi:hypothetical protein